jgi:CelD/BcsL family acetyltransferase involved in cellulose biosynthesis
MKLTTIAAHELDSGALARWRALQGENDALASPYFCPEYTLAVAAVRDDLRVTVLEEGGEIVGFFPHQRGPLGACRPAGGVLSDHHGVIAAAGTQWRWREVLRAAGLSHWRFDHLVGSQANVEVAALRASESPALDLSRGFAAYRAARLERGSRRIAELDRKARKLAREVGPVRFELQAGPEVLKRVIAWKSEQCRRTGALDFFARGSARALVERILHTREPAFAGALSAVYAGEALVAAHMGMRSESVWHWWFPTYDHAFAKYSPGALLLLRLAEAAADQGVSTLDLGKGNDGYKESFADKAIPLAEGLLARRSPLNVLRGAGVHAERWMRESASLERVRPALRQLRQLRDRAAPA